MARLREETDRTAGWLWLGRSAFALMLALVLSRCLLTEFLRDPLPVVAGGEAVPLQTGPTTSLALDLLQMLPAVLVLIRRGLDRDDRLRRSWSGLLLILLGVWTVLSTLWAADRFAALVTSMHWMSAMVLLWSALQLTDSWLRLRIVGGACIGLLLCLSATGYYFHWVGLADQQSAWDTQKTQILAMHNWVAGSFEAKILETRFLSPAPLGFSSSPNTYAALLALLGTIVAGVAIQRYRDRDDWGWVAIPLLAVVAAVPCLLWARSRGAAATAMGSAILLTVLVLRHRKPRFNPRRVYWITLGSIVAVIAAVVGHGLYHHTLFHNSLTFRWRYWVGAARLIAAHPLLGVGWDDFGLRYLAWRLPIASEEVQDPHNFVIRFLGETGIVGGLLLIFGLLRLAWEATQSPLRDPVAPVDEEFPDVRALRNLATHRILVVASLAIVVNFFASVDLNSSIIFLGAMLRALFWLLLIVGIAAATLRLPPPTQRRLRDPELEYFSDQRPAPWICYGLLVGLAMFLLHNGIDFALFEPGPTALFAMLCGAALGARQTSQRSARLNPLAAIATALAATALWVVVAVALILPVGVAESLAQQSDESVRLNDSAAGAAKMEEAFARLPLNSDYAFRAGTLRAGRGENARAYDLFDAAIRTNPAVPAAFVWRTDMAIRLHRKTSPAPLDDLRSAVALDPCDVDLRERYGQMLKHFAQPDAAREQFRQALTLDAELEPGDPKHLNPTDLSALRRFAQQ